MEEKDLTLIDSTDDAALETNDAALGTNDDDINQEGEVTSVNLNELDSNPTAEAEQIYSIIEEAIPQKDGVRRNLSQRDFALWVLPILAINRIRRFNTSLEIVKPYDKKNNQPYEIKGDETIYTNTKNTFEGKDTMRFFGFRFMSIWVFPIAITGAVMEFLFVGPLKGTNPFG
tara:strand:+ start:1826 stop:2344 length:519 start_codon:yes stop_codon:yes gene_type:complete